MLCRIDKVLANIGAKKEIPTLDNIMVLSLVVCWAACSIFANPQTVKIPFPAFLSTGLVRMRPLIG